MLTEVVFDSGVPRIFLSIYFTILYCSLKIVSIYMVYITFATGKLICKIINQKLHNQENGLNKYYPSIEKIHTINGNTNKDTCNFKIAGMLTL